MTAKYPHRFWFKRTLYDDIQEAFIDQHLSDLGHHIELYPKGRNRFPDLRSDQGWGPKILIEVKRDPFSTAGLEKLADKYYQSPLNIWLMCQGLALNDHTGGPRMHRVAGICDPKKNNGANTIVYVDRGDGSHLLQPYWEDDDRRAKEWPPESTLSDTEYIHYKWLGAKEKVKNSIYEYMQLELPLPVASESEPIQTVDDETG